MKIEFSNRKYERSHMRAPKGTGSWIFECEGYELEAWGTLTEAKKQARERIKALAPQDYKGTVVAYILP